ncbi:MAG: hypothetical protein HOQ18_07620 [Dermatophilaceae bacterium]|nr:hypothetical protein [Dermatophilaceae bacterium]
MSVWLRTAGLTVEVSAVGPAASRWTRLVREACAGQELAGQELGGQELGGPELGGPGPSSRARAADLVVTVGHGEPVGPGPRHRLVTRGAWTDGHEVILQDACSSGLDLVLHPREACLQVVAHPAPDWRHRALGLAAPDRRLLLHRAALLQFPALWWAGVHGRVPLHVSAAVVAGHGVVLAGPGGVGKSTLIATLDAATGAPVSDNLCTSDGSALQGLLEPARTDIGTGRRMPHGRRESGWLRHVDGATPSTLLVLRRADDDTPDPVVRHLDPATAAREIVGGTYAAGELRRYWTFAATLALATGRGPAHPPVAKVAELLTRRLPAYEVRLPNRPGVTLEELVDRARALPVLASGEAWRP